MSPRFLLDGMLGRLCRKMRMLGIDCELTAGGRSHLLLTDAESAGRTAVTTATRAVDRCGPPPVVLKRSGAAEMIAELYGKTGDEIRFAPFTLCLECNEQLRDIAAGELSTRVPPRILHDFKEFHECGKCGRVYWKGSHYDAMRAQVERMIARIEERVK
jgi:uncharacterized protein with PIN domain